MKFSESYFRYLAITNFSYYNTNQISFTELERVAVYLVQTSLKHLENGIRRRPTDHAGSWETAGSWQGSTPVAGSYRGNWEGN